MLEIGICKCGQLLKTDDTYYNHNNFEGHVFCSNCHRLYYMEIKNQTVRLGKCFKILKDFSSPYPLSDEQFENIRKTLSDRLVGYKPILLENLDAEVEILAKDKLLKINTFLNEINNKCEMKLNDEK